MVNGAKLERGAALSIRLTRRDTLGTVTTWRFRSPKVPPRTMRCLVPGPRKARVC
jgi:hypothetical protein